MKKKNKITFDNFLDQNPKFKKNSIKNMKSIKIDPNEIKNLKLG